MVTSQELAAQQARAREPVKPVENPVEEEPVEDSPVEEDEEETPEEEGADLDEEIAED